MASECVRSSRKLLFITAGTLLLAGVFDAATSTSSTKDWPEFRGATGQGISTAKNVPVKWSATNQVAWKAEIPGTGWSSPVLANGKIYLTTAVSDPALS